MLNTIVVVTSETPTLSVRLSVICVPTTLISTTAEPVDRRRRTAAARNWNDERRDSSAPVMNVVFVSPRPTLSER